MSMTENEANLDMASMAFLYQNDQVGKPGAAGAVEVKDVPKAEVLSYTWQGTDSKDNVAKAKAAIDAALAEKNSRSIAIACSATTVPPRPNKKPPGNCRHC